MITSIKDQDERIIAYIESWQVGQSGIPKYRGEYLWVHDLWIHYDYRGKDILSQLIWKMLSSVPDVRFGYWKRRKYNGRISKLYNRDEFSKLLMKMERYYGRRHDSRTTSGSHSTVTR